MRSVRRQLSDREPAFELPSVAMRRAPRQLVALALAALVISCGEAARKPVEAAPSEPPKPKNAAAIAQSIAGGKVSVLVYAERAAGHPIAARLAALDLWQPVLAGTGIDPTRDLVRAFVTAPKADAGWESVAVLEHKLPHDKLEAAVDALLARSDPPGTRLEGLGVPAVQVTVQGQRRVIAEIEPAFLVVLPEAKAQEARRFVGTGGFPDAAGPEVAVASAIEPSRTLKAPRVPPIPNTLSALSAKVVLSADGGADLAIDGVSTSPEQAKQDAADMKESFELATTVRIAVVKIRVVDPIEFFPEENRVKANRHVTPAELDKVFTLLSAVLPR